MMRMTHSTSAGTAMLPQSSAPSYERSTPGQSTLGGQVFSAVDTVSRRMEDLAREFDCLGYFDDEDGPRAA